MYEFAFYFILAIPVLALVSPWAWVPRLWIAVILVIIFAEIAKTPDLNPGIADVVGYAFVVLFMAICLFLLWIRYLVGAWRAGRNGVRFEPAMKSGKALRGFDFLLLFAFGALIGILITSMLGNALERAYRGFLLHVMISLFCLLAVVLLFWVKSRFNQPRRAALAIALGGFITLGFLSGLGLLQPYAVMASTMQIADSRPHCVLLLDRMQEPRSWEDLTFFTMDKRRRQHHAMLLVQGKHRLWPYHWSYRKQRFLPGIVNWDNHRRPKERCVRTTDFSDSLPLFNP
ncbi:MAG: hypothetical protein RIC87_22825 [Kiloniellales bacterium]